MSCCSDSLRNGSSQTRLQETASQAARKESVQNQSAQINGPAVSIVSTLELRKLQNSET